MTYNVGLHRNRKYGRTAFCSPLDYVNYKVWLTTAQYRKVYPDRFSSQLFLSHVSIIPPVLNIHTFSYHRCCINLAVESVVKQHIRKCLSIWDNTHTFFFWRNSNTWHVNLKVTKCELLPVLYPFWELCVPMFSPVQNTRRGTLEALQTHGCTEACNLIICSVNIVTNDN